MRWTNKPDKTRKPGALYRLAFVTACAVATASCAGLSRVADAPRLEQPEFTRRICAVSVVKGDTLADLELAYRARGVDVQECDARRALAVQVSDEEHRLEKAWACRLFGLGCANVRP